MSMPLRILTGHPTAFFTFDDDSPFFDHSGCGKAGTATGTPPVHGSLANGVTTSRVFSSANTATIESGVFIRNSDSFTLQATFSTIAKTNETSDVIQVLGHAGGYDGIVVDGTKVAFVTKYPNTGESRAEFDLQELANVNVWGVHSKTKNSLYINGLLVSEAEINDEQQLDDFAYTSQNLTIGTTTSTREVAVALVATYPTALNDTEIREQQKWSRTNETPSSIASQSNGIRIPLDRTQFDLFVEKLWTNQEQWEQGQFNNTIVLDNAVVPVYASDTSMPGEWLDSVYLDTPGVTEIYSMSIGWDGFGGTVEASLDGTTWTEVTNGHPIPFIENGFNPTGKFLYVKVKFAGGIVDDPSYFDNLEVIGFRTPNPGVIAGRTITYPANAFVQKDFSPVDRADNWGTTLNGGSLSVSTSADTTARTLGAVEIWVRQLPGTAFSTNISGATVYHNGLPSSTLRQNEWTLVTVVPPTPVTGGFTISGKVQIGQIVMYAFTPDADKVKALASRYTTPPRHISQEESTLQVDSETGMVAKVYAHEWVIAGTG